MILGIEIALLIYGLYALIKGEFAVGGGKKLCGAPARILGAICLLPLLVVFAVAFAVGAYLGMQGVTAQQMETEYHWTFVGIEAGIVIFMAILIVVLSKILYGRQEREAARAAPPTGTH